MAKQKMMMIKRKEITIMEMKMRTKIKKQGKKNKGKKNKVHRTSAIFGRTEMPFCTTLEPTDTDIEHVTGCY
jgi:hypothetical protein